mmetsp:Transcript_15646/g.24314  ORF Transcript_15646/g.24314 Transcript_15646/m.24314 type:complete len:100 (+) Transcript_15646:76-375(+)
MTHDGSVLLFNGPRGPRATGCKGSMRPGTTSFGPPMATSCTPRGQWDKGWGTRDPESHWSRKSISQGIKRGGKPAVREAGAEGLHGQEGEGHALVTNSS